MNSLHPNTTAGLLNVLHDGNNTLRPQSERLPIIGSMLGQLSLNVACLLEFPDDERAAYEMTEQLEMQNYRFVLNGNRHKSGILVMGNNVEFEEIPIDKEENRTAVIAHYSNGTAVAAVHASHYVTGGAMRVRQIQELLSRTEGLEQLMLLGDFNALPWQRPRQILMEHGFMPAFEKFPKTFPATAAKGDLGQSTSKYSKYTRPFIQKYFEIFGPIALDGTYVRGADSIEEAELISARIEQDGEPDFISDHHGHRVKAKWRNEQSLANQ